MPIETSQARSIHQQIAFLEEQFETPTKTLHKSGKVGFSWLEPVIKLEMQISAGLNGSYSLSLNDRQENGIYVNHDLPGCLGLIQRHVFPVFADLKKIGEINDGLTFVYHDVKDNSFWELSNPESFFTGSSSSIIQLVDEKDLRI